MEYGQAETVGRMHIVFRNMFLQHHKSTAGRRIPEGGNVSAVRRGSDSGNLCAAGSQVADFLPSLLDAAPFLAG